MKLSASYNAFDGLELIKESIQRIRPHVDYISVVFQFVSNRGIQCNKGDAEYLISLKEEGLINNLVKFTPDLLAAHPHYNEQSKRNLGLQLAMNNDCTHHMTVDCDEYYISNEFRGAKYFIENNDVDSSAVMMQTYYGDKNHVLEEPETYWCPFIFKIHPHQSKFALANKYPYFCDPTRRIIPLYKHPHLFKREVIQMHHLSYVRNDLTSKMMNSSAKSNWKDEDVQEILTHHKEWNPNKLIGYFPDIHKVNKLKLKKIDWLEDDRF